MVDSRRALVLGSTHGRLSGVLGDVSAVAEVLPAWGFEVRTLWGPRATRERILSAYEQLVEDTEPGDVAVVYYAGHGCHTDAPSGVVGRADARHRFITPSDFGEADPSTGDFRGILDVELSHLQGRLTGKTDNVVVILDCCHAARMSKGDERRPRAVPTAEEWTAVVDARVRALMAAGQVSHTRLVADNPLAVRLVACAPDEQAFESDEGGDFTRALVAALTEARAHPSMTWRRLMAYVQDAVLSAGFGQRPEVEGPADRRLFELLVQSSAGALPLREAGGELVLGGGVLLGVEVGDEYVVMAPEEAEPVEARALARLRVVEARGTTSRVQAESPGLGGPIEPGTQAFLVAKSVRRGVVRVEGEGLVLDALRRAIAGSGGLREWRAGERPAMAMVRQDADQLWVLDGQAQPWLVPRADDGRALDGLLHDLEVLAHGEAVLRLQGGCGSAALPVGLEVEWGRVRNGVAEALAPTNERIDEGDLVYVKVGNPAGSGLTLFVSILDVGLTGRVTVVSDWQGTGLVIQPGQHAGIGLHPYRGVVGYGPVTWPAAAQRGTERAETLVIVATDEPHDLRGLQTGGARTKGPPEPEGGRWLVEHISMLVVPAAP